jgi:hypothetical protein
MPAVTEAIVEKEEVKPVKKINLVEYLEKTLDKWPTDILQVTHIYGSNFRVNWMKPVTYKDSILSTFRMRKSQFLKAEAVGDDVVVEVKSETNY